MRHSKCCVPSWMTAALLAGIAWCAPASEARDAATAREPAYWGHFNEIDHLENLPRTYDCDALYYKYRDVLQALGARPGMKIYAYGCGRNGGGGTRSPRVHVTFDAPMRVPPAVRTLSPNLWGSESAITLSPGHPRSLTARDCALLNAMRGTLLASLQARLDTDGLNCQSRRAAQGNFALIVHALIAQPASDSAAPRSEIVAAGH